MSWNEGKTLGVPLSCANRVMTIPRINTRLHPLWEDMMKTYKLPMIL